jgi:uncharacterized membrane protein
MIATLMWGAPEWVIPAAIIAVVSLVVLVWSYTRTSGPTHVRAIAATLKAIGIGLLTLCLLDPLSSTLKPQPGANLFVIVADNSQSLQVLDEDEQQSRAEQLQEQLERKSKWQTRLAQDFDVRRYTFDTRLKPVADFTRLTLDGAGSMMLGSMQTLGGRFDDRPLAGVLLFSDGNATDLIGADFDWAKMPPIYPVVLGKDQVGRDISVTRVSVNETNFEAIPVTLIAEIVAHGIDDEPILVELLDEEDKVVEKQIVKDFRNGEGFSLRFQLKPDRRGVFFYKVRATAESDSNEATLLNNSRLAMVDRGGGPYRIIYVTGRPNWEFKFLSRAVEKDDEVDLVGLTRLAKREPKFTFRSGRDESSNPFFKGFENQDKEEVEQYDEAKIIRIGTDDDSELRDGFPKSADELFRYDAIILDDVESSFFNQDQMSLIDEFVQRRGGGLLMLGGQESFVRGDYRRTSIGEILPVYLDPIPNAMDAGSYRFSLTREGWLEPWARIEATEAKQRQRLDAMPRFRTLNRVRSIKPAATVVAHAESADGTKYPALVIQEFGKGRTAALLIGDIWRWHMRRETTKEDDTQRFWRQVSRWLVANGQKRLDVETRRESLRPGQPVRIVATLRDPEFMPLDNATVKIKIDKPDGKQVEITAEPNEENSGVYQTTIASGEPGAYRAMVIATAEDGSEIARRETGWVSEPATDEFRRLAPNKDLLQRIAKESGGEVIEADRLDRFVRDLPTDRIPITESLIEPIWHKWTIFLLAVGCLVGEWGLRRWKGMP